DHSKISEERLLEYKEAEEGSGVTLVGPHRDDFFVLFEERPPLAKASTDDKSLADRSDGQGRNLKSFGSRGQQRLAILQLKILQLDFIEESLGERPLLLLDDIFSELDSSHIDLVMENINRQQTIITTTHKEFVEKRLKNLEVIELENGKN
ncbi:MAG: hypothetical protein HYV38_02665, partial [Candidatus Levybacteria bacterium]|nr:hypothetical protein [Candidatus Levybacteria bacterium]